jgi:hemoglobin
MSQRRIYVPPGGPGPIAPPDPAIFAAMGTEPIFQMLEEFYRELEGSWLRVMFPQDMVAASQKSAAFFVGLLGGPPLYHQRYGNPAMRARHMPFLIDEEAKAEWLRCFERVLDHAPERYNFPAEHLPGFRAFLHGFAGWMVNTAPEDSPWAETPGDV